MPYPDYPTSRRLDLSLAAKSLPPRQEHQHKYQSGQVLVIASSAAYPGAGQLVCHAAYRSGAGMVRWAVPAGLSPSWLLPEAIPLTLSTGDNSELLEWLQADEVQAIVYGPGLGRDEATLAQARHLLPVLLQQTTKTLIVDADGLFHLSGLLPEGATLGPHVIVTPHLGEARYLAPDVDWCVADLALLRLQERLNCHILLKTPRLLYASPNGELIASQLGNNGMATAGTGDVLAGILGGLAAQQPDQPQATCLAGMALHGLAGDLASEQLTPYSLMASDLIDMLPSAFHTLLALNKNPP